MKATLHRIKGFVISNPFDDKIRIQYPDGRVVWTSSFSVVREVITKEGNQQLKLF